MDNRAIYLIMFTLSALLSLAIKLNSEDYTGINGGLDVLLGSVMSYLYIVILVSGYVTFAHSVTNRKLSNCIISITCGALLWEIHQAFIPEMYFDWKDMVATLMAFTALMLIQHYKPVGNSEHGSVAIGKG